MTTEFQPTTVSSMDDIIRILEQQPAWADRMRGIILGQELLALPAQFHTFAQKTDQAIEELRDLSAQFHAFAQKTDQAIEELRDLSAQFHAFAQKTDQAIEELRQGQEELRQGQEELRQGQDKLWENQREMRQDIKALQDDVANLKGTDYEARAATNLAALMPDTAGLTRIRVIKSIKTPESENLAETLDSAIESGTAAPEEIRDLRLSDIIASARHSGPGQWGYAVCEASVTLGAHDIERAARRAQAMRKAAAAPATPVVIGTAITPELQSQADRAGVTVIILRY